jgi:hypothetical protein
MTDTKSLSERLRTIKYMRRGSLVEASQIADEAADALDDRDAAIVLLISGRSNALDAKDAEIELLKEGRKLHDELADHLEHKLAAQSALLAQTAAALWRIVDVEDASSGSDRGDLVASREIAREALAAIRGISREDGVSTPDAAGETH